MIKFICVNCYKKLEVEDDQAGKGINCSRCGQLIWVPNPSDPRLFPDEVFDQLDDSPFTGKKRCQNCRTVFAAEDFEPHTPLSIRQARLAQMRTCPQCGGRLLEKTGKSKSSGCMLPISIFILMLCLFTIAGSKLLMS